MCWSCRSSRRRELGPLVKSNRCRILFFRKWWGDVQGIYGWLFTDKDKTFADKAITWLSYTYLRIEILPRILKSSTLDVRRFSYNALYEKRDSISRGSRCINFNSVDVPWSTRRINLDKLQNMFQSVCADRSTAELDTAIITKT